MRPARLKLLILSGLFLAIAGFSLFRSSPPLTHYGDESAARAYRMERDKLESVLKTRGAAAAYETYRSDYRDNPRDRTFHNLGHWLGSELYLAEGLAGIARCDETAGYGCFHGFFGAAYRSEGEGLLPSAVAQCAPEAVDDRSIECVHGIGHGFLSLFGYGKEDLLRALQGCHGLPAPAFLKSICGSGAFMEYNIRTMQETADAKFSVRELDPRNPYDPCPALPVSFREACYHELPYWWAAAGPANAAELGERCDAAPEAREACFRGIGRLLPWLSSDPERAGAECARMPHPEAQALCVEDAAKRLFLRAGGGAADLCLTLPYGREEKCREYIREFDCEISGICDAEYP